MFKLLNGRVVGLALVAFAAALACPAIALAQVGLVSQSRNATIFSPSGTLGQSASTFGVWNQDVSFGFPGDNEVSVQSDVSETSIRLNGNSTVWQPGNATSASPVVVNANIAFSLFSQASINLTVGDGLGVFGGVSFTLTGPSGVVASGRSVNIASGSLLPGAYTLSYNFTHNYNGFASAGPFGFTLNFTGFQPGPSAITYQGKIEGAGGAPVNEPYDIGFTVYAEPTGGAPLLFGLEKTNVPVSNGVFTTSFDFGNTPWETTENRWLEVAVRPSSGTGGSTVLSPRQRIGAAPRALYATKAGAAQTAEVASSIDLSSRGLVRGATGASGNSPGLIFATPVSNPVFRSFIGMADDNNVGFFGYAGGGWSLTTRTDTGRVGIGTLNPQTQLEVAGTVRATGFQYASLQSRSVMLGYTDFRCTGAENAVVNNISFGIAGPNPSNASLIATVPLPIGARLESITIHYRDSDPTGNLRAALLRYNLSVPNMSLVAGDINLTDSSPLPTSRTVTLPGNTVVDTQSVFIVQIFPVDGLWGPTDSKTVQAVRVNYTVGSPD